MLWNTYTPVEGCDTSKTPSKRIVHMHMLKLLTSLHAILRMQNAFNCKCLEISERKFICEGSSDVIACPPGSIINIEYANYGRTSPRSAAICDDSRDSNQACMAAGSADIITQACDGKESCSLDANNDVFGEPCGGTSKYIEIRFTCQGKCSNDE